VGGVASGGWVWLRWGCVWLRAGWGWFVGGGVVWAGVGGLVEFWDELDEASRFGGGVGGEPIEFGEEGGCVGAEDDVDECGEEAVVGERWVGERCGEHVLMMERRRGRSRRRCGKAW